MSCFFSFFPGAFPVWSTQHIFLNFTGQSKRRKIEHVLENLKRCKRSTRSTVATEQTRDTNRDVDQMEMAHLTKELVVIAESGLFKHKIRETLRREVNWSMTTDNATVSLSWHPEVEDPSVEYIMAVCKCTDSVAACENLIHCILPRMAQGFGPTNSIACTTPEADSVLAGLAQHYMHTPHGPDGIYNGRCFLPKWPSRDEVILPGDLRLLKKILELFVVGPDHPAAKPGRIVRGVKASEDIVKHQALCLYDDGGCLRVIKSLPREVAKYMMHHMGTEGAVGSLTGKLMCEGSPLGDSLGPMMNTRPGSNNARIETVLLMVDGRCYARLVALAMQPIRKGEEVFLEYGETYDDLCDE